MAPRRARHVIAGATYHVLTRGNNGQTVFPEAGDARRYLELLASAVRLPELRLYHYVLLPADVHLLLQVLTPEALSQAMRRLNLRYALFYRSRYGYRGHLWQGRFQSLPLDAQQHPIEAGLALELLPVQARLVPEPAAYPWSSYPTYAAGLANELLARNPHYEALGETAPIRQARYRLIQEALRRRLLGGSDLPHDLRPHAEGVPNLLATPFTTAGMTPSRGQGRILPRAPHDS